VSSAIGDLLREWRAARRVSQLDLALAADVSPRHLSYVETGKAQPSRELIDRLAEALQVSMRDRNALLMSAGYAPGYHETAIAAPKMAAARRAIELILKQQEPYPAIVTTRHWDIVMANQGATRLFAWLLGGRSAERNAMRMVFDPAVLRPLIVNWEAVALDLIRQLHADVASAPLDPGARALLHQVLAYPGVPSRWRTHEVWDAPVEPLWTVTYHKDGRDLTFFWTVTTFATPRDVTLEELRIECHFPADEATEQLCHQG
jgi:transcriptional regulator with XRE-family HTH domain